MEGGRGVGGRLWSLPTAYWGSTTPYWGVGLTRGVLLTEDLCGNSTLLYVRTP